MLKLFEKLADMIYPRRCVFCGRFPEKNTKENICRKCITALPYTGADSKTKGEFFKSCISPLYYSDKAGEAVRRFKFKGKSAYAACFGKLIASCVLMNYGREQDIITYVPISRARMKKRGYCQAELLAESAAAVLETECCTLLKKKRHTPPQSTLKGLAPRKANVSGAFECVNRDKIAGKKILLIDDVVTTGATIAECSRMLLMAGAESVRCATLCKAGKRRKK